MKYSVIIVDDEKNICSLIKNEIEWDRLGLTLAGIYNDSTDALSAIVESAPDIVITDIQMPGCSGLEMIEQVRERDIACNFIIISGYSYFEYAKQAVKYGVESYILKPIDHGELNDSLEKLCHKMNSSNIAASDVLREKMDVAALRDYYVGALASNKTTLDLAAVNSRFHFKFREGSFYAAVLRIDRYMPMDQGPITAPRLTNSLNRNIGNICYDFHITGTDQFSYTVLLNCALSSSPMLMRGLQYIIDECNNEYLLGSKAALTISLSSGYTDISRSGAAVSQAKQLSDCRAVIGVNKLNCYNDFTPAIADFEQELGALQGRLSASVSTLSREEAVSACRSYIDGACARLLSAPLSLCSFSNDLQMMVRTLLKTPPQRAFVQASDFDDFKAFGDAMLEEIGVDFSEYESGFISGDRRIVLDVKNYIQTHMSEKLDLECLSESVFISAGYLGQLFKRETGVNITQYINEARIDEAKKLLLQSRYTVSDVADITGYKDAKYFTRIFKRQTGISPTEYRRIHRVL